ncbi:MAG TPA: SulP family inorganic anion transporter [Anaerolineales bacterium]|nr:SulP family inorganic anion transporter [Anaerolineales bacterium]
MTSAKARFSRLRQSWRDSGAREAVRHVRPGQLAREYIPILVWGRAYQAAWLRQDLIGGLTTWAVMIPSAMAYAQLAGVPAQYGLYAAMAAMAVYPLFSTSRHLRVTTSSTMAVMSAAIVLPLAASGENLLTLTAGLALVVGSLLLISGVLRLGFLGDFLSKPVITGFLFGLGINIIVGQLPKIFGIPASSGNTVQQFIGLLRNLPETNRYTLAIGLGAAFLIIELRRRAAAVPGPLVAVLYGILVGKTLALQDLGVTTVGAIPLGLPAFGFPHLSPGNLAYLLAAAGSMVFLALGESLAAARLYAARHRYRIRSDNELIALGAANLASSFVGGITVDASMSTTATSEAAGSRTQLASLVTAGLTVLTVLFLARLLEDLPNAVLAAIVIASVIGLLNVPEMRRFWEASRVDFLMGMAALLGVIFSDPGSGLILAVFLSLAVVLYRASRPRVTALGREPGNTEEFIDLARHPEAEPIPDLVTLRLEAGLFYANANEIRRAIEAEVEKRPSPPKGVLLEMGATGYIDLTSIDVLVELVRELREQSITVILAHVLGKVRDQLREAGVMQVIGEANVVNNLAAGVRVLALRAAGEVSEKGPPAHGETTLAKDV